PTGGLGPIGYLYESVRIIGFLLGVFLVYRHLKGKPYCESCKRYFGPMQLLAATPDPAEVDSFANSLWFDVSTLAAQYRAVIGERDSKMFRVVMAACKTCDLKQIRFMAGPRGGGEDLILFFFPMELVEVFSVYNFRGLGPFREHSPIYSGVSTRFANIVRFTDRRWCWLEQGPRLKG